MSVYQHTFQWPASQANEVYVSGTFDNWSKQHMLSKDSKNGNFTLTLELPPSSIKDSGKVLYKFVVDGNWTTSTGDKVEYDQSGFENNVVYLADLESAARAALNVSSSPAPVPTPTTTAAPSKEVPQTNVSKPVTAVAPPIESTKNEPPLSPEQQGPPESADATSEFTSISYPNNDDHDMVISVPSQTSNEILSLDTDDAPGGSGAVVNGSINPGSVNRSNSTDDVNSSAQVTLHDAQSVNTNSKVNDTLISSVNSDADRKPAILSAGNKPSSLISRLRSLFRG